MIFDGLLEPITIIIKLPRSLKDKFTVQYEATGLTAAVAAEESLKFISETVQKYISAGSPCVIVDEDNNLWHGIGVPITSQGKWTPNRGYGDTPKYTGPPPALDS